MGITFENLGSEARIQYVNPTYLGYLHEGDVFDIAFTNRTFKLTVRADMDGDVISPNYGVVHDGRKTEHRQNSEGIDYPPYINVKVAFKDQINKALQTSKNQYRTGFHFRRESNQLEHQQHKCVEDEIKCT